MVWMTFAHGLERGWVDDFCQWFAWMVSHSWLASIMVCLKDLGGERRLGRD